MRQNKKNLLKQHNTTIDLEFLVLKNSQNYNLVVNLADFTQIFGQIFAIDHP